MYKYYFLFFYTKFSLSHTLPCFDIIYAIIYMPVFTSQNVEALDPRGRTLLHLAVSLGHLESARVLLRHKADVTKENREGWTGKYTLKIIESLLFCYLSLNKGQSQS